MSWVMAMPWPCAASVAGSASVCSTSREPTNATTIAPTSGSHSVSWRSSAPVVGIEGHRPTSGSDDDTTTAITAMPPNRTSP